MRNAGTGGGYSSFYADVTFEGRDCNEGTSTGSTCDHHRMVTIAYYEVAALDIANLPLKVKQYA